MKNLSSIVLVYNVDVLSVRSVAINIPGNVGFVGITKDFHYRTFAIIRIS